MIFKDYLIKLEIDKNEFTGQYVQVEGKQYGFFRNIISKNGKLLLNLDNGKRESVGVNGNFVQSNNLEHEQFYSFRLHFAPQELREKYQNNFYCSIVSGNPPVNRISKNPFEEIIKNRYERLYTPDANLIIANLLREIGKGMYSSKKRMIFELLQNADDVPVNGETKFFIETYKDYLLIAHNGLPFNEDDVKSITSAAESTKQKNQKKTGYKGIGFKSVFTDSSRVLIKSGGFLFEFYRDNESYFDFDEFYFNRPKYIKYPGLREDESKFFADAKAKFTGYRDIPWQILPVWRKSPPIDLVDSNFSNNNNVGIALKIGESKLKSYSDEIRKLAHSGRFILFLRHVNFFKFSNDNLTIHKSISNGNQVSIKVKSRNGEQRYDYVVRDFDHIRVDNLAFEENKISIRKENKTIEGEMISYFVDLEGNQIEAIPPKIASFKTTTISFAAPIIKGKVQCEPTFKSYKDFSYLFTYLPMREYRIKLPFLVNADFVPSSNREEIQDIGWNTYIFSQIGKLCVEWISSLADINNPEYLTLLLPKELKSEESDVLPAISKFNENYTQAIVDIAYILDDIGEKRKSEEVILDLTDFSKVFDSEIFYKISKTEKKLPAAGLNIDILHKDIFGIEKYSSSDLANALVDESAKEILEEGTVKMSEEEYLSFIAWFDQFLSEEENKTILKEFPNNLKLFRFPFEDNRIEFHSWNEVSQLDDYLLLDRNLSSISNQLKKLGFNTSQFDIAKFSSLYNSLEKEETYLGKEPKFLFDKVSAKFPQSNLLPADKLTLYKLFKRLDTEEARNKIAIFKNHKGELLPLSKMIDSSPSFYSNWLANFKIDSEEEKALGDLISDLAQEDEIYNSFLVDESKREHLLENLDIDSLKDFYEFVWSAHDVCDEKAKLLNSLPIIFTNENSGYKKLGEVYYHKRLIDINDYQLVKRAIEKLTDYVLPHEDALPFMKKWDVAGSTKLITHAIVEEKTLFSIEEAAGLLSFIADIDRKDKIFEYGYFISEGDQIIFKKTGNCKNFSLDNDANHSLLASLLENDFTQYHPLPAPLRNVPKLSELGLEDASRIMKFILDEPSNQLFFVRYLEQCTPIQKRSWLEKDLEIVLSSEKEYYDEDDEIRVLKILLEFKDDALIKLFRTKITLDGKAIKDIAVEDKVIIKNDDFQYIFSLSKLIPTYVGQSNILEAFIQNCKNLISADELNKIFNPEEKKTSELINELGNKNDYDVEQYVFAQVYNRDKADAYSHLIEKGQNDFSTQVLDFCYSKSKDNKYPLLTEFISDIGFLPNSHLYPEDLSFGNDKLPDWVLNWIKESPGKLESKIEFLGVLGLNLESSHMGYLRSIFIRDKVERKDEINEVVQKIGDLKSCWLSRTCDMINIQKIDLTEERITVYKAILERVDFRTDILLPVIEINETGEEIEDFVIPFDEGIKVYDGRGLELIKNDYPDTDYSERIRNIILESGDRILSTGLRDIWYEDAQVFVIESNMIFDAEKLKDASDVNDDKYFEWEYKDDYPVKFLNTNIPQNVFFEEHLIDTIYSLKQHRIDGVIYFNSNEYTFLPRLLDEYASGEEMKSYYALFENLGDTKKANEKISVLESENEKLRNKLKNLGFDPDSLESSSQPSIIERSGSPSSGNSTPQSSAGTSTPSVFIPEDEFNNSSVATHYSHLDKSIQIEISQETREMIKQELISLGYRVPEPFGNSSIVNGVYDKNGISVPIVAKSAKSSRLAMHPNEWIQLMQKNSRLFLRLKNDIITTASLEEILSTEDRFQLDFSKQHVSQELILALANVFKWVKDVKFVVPNPNSSFTSLEKSFIPEEGRAGVIDLFGNL